MSKNQLDVLAKPSKEFFMKNRDKWTLEGMAVSARDHLGRTTDNSQIMDLVVDAGCGYFGARAANNVRALAGGSASPEDIFAGIVIGLLGRRLATAFGGTPPVAQIAGLSILGSIGLIDVAPSISQNLDALGFGPLPFLDPAQIGFDLAKLLSGRK